MPDREKVISQIEVDYREAERKGEILVPISRRTVKDALALLKEQPKIVRCKDCKYYDHFNGCMSWHDVNSNNDNWYCADWEGR